MRWGGGSQGAPLSHHASKKRQRRLSSVDEEQRRFAGRVREAFGKRTGATKASDVEEIMTALGRTAPRRLLDHALSALGFDERQSLDEQAVVDLCLIIEKRRARAVVDRCKRHSADLMHVSGNDDFVRVVGTTYEGYCGAPLNLPTSPTVQMFDLFIMVILLYVFVSLPLCLAFDRINARLKWYRVLSSEAIKTWVNFAFVSVKQMASGFPNPGAEATVCGGAALSRRSRLSTLRPTR